MTPQMIGVYGDGDELIEQLRQRCPSWIFTDGSPEREACRVVVMDGDAEKALDLAPQRKSLVHVILTDEPPPARRRIGELRLSKAIFLSAPADYLNFAVDLADTAIHASQLEQEVSYLTQIHELMAMIDADAVSERVTRTVLNIIGLPQGTLFLHDPRLERYVVSFSNESVRQDTAEFLPGVPPDLLQGALNSGQLVAIDHRLRIVIMPLRSEDDLIGVIRVPLGSEGAIDDESFAGVTRYLTAVAQVLGNVYQMTRSRDLAMRDDLTKAFNRRFFESYLDEEMERARRYGSLFSIIFLDLDDLKKVNNAYGHLTGSRTLQEVAKRILSAVRGIDKVVRFGGDEFCIILPQTDQDQAVAVAKRVKRALTSSVFRLDPDIEVNISASFGIASYPTNGITKEDLIRQADSAMYRVKSSTKNAVGIATVDDAPKPA